jgi:hypothetical protein
MRMKTIGPVWEVRFMTSGNRRRSKTFRSEDEALRFAAAAGGDQRGPKTADEVKSILQSRSAPDGNGCRVWMGPITNAGYGRMAWTGTGRIEYGAHRIAYLAFVGPIPSGLVVDHLCRNRLCVNPEHLEPVTVRENVMRSPIAQAAINARKTHCPKGHPYTSENTTGGPNARACRTCLASRPRSNRRQSKEEQP